MLKKLNPDDVEIFIERGVKYPGNTTNMDEKPKVKQIQNTFQLIDKLMKNKEERKPLSL